jgi:hypothetical protein
MTPQELALECKRIIETQTTARICLVVPGAPPKGTHVSLDRTRHWRKSPRGEVANWQDSPPRTVAYFDAIDVLAYLKAIGAVDVEVRVKP